MNERSFFGTDGIRGRANEPPLTVDFALLVGKAAATLAWEGRGESKEGRKPRILLGRDTRLSGQALVSAIAAGATSSGADVFELGVLPTPAVALLANSMRADLAIVVTASHNPFEDNGIKFFNNEGRKLSDELEARIEVFLRGEEKPCRVSAAKMGRMYDLSSASDRYVEIILRTFPREKSLEDLRVVLDCANGAASRTSPQILEELGANLTVLNARPDGTNINRKCGSNFPEVLAHEVCRLQADVGIAHDGDADRVVLVDEKGTVLDGDEILAIAALNMIERGKLPGNSIVATVMSNFGLDELLERYGGKVWRTNVGDRFVA
ncbi:MAG: phosphoglucosamine mutase, partial [Chthoniobacterales bacterium]|nr:phosphoglucosamine mutase [Chthoniobacterales bacterium]